MSPSCTYLNAESGFIDQPVYCLLKSDHGYMWISTEQGIYTYDGSHLKPYPLTHSEVLTDADGRQIRLHQSASGKVWAFTDSGRIFYYDPYSDSYQLYLDSSSLEPGILLNDLYIDEEQQCILLATSAGIYEYNMRRQDYDRNGSILETVFINRLVPVSTTQVAICTRRGLYLYDRSVRSFRGEPLCPGEDILTALYLEEANQLWFGSFTAGFYGYSPETDTLLIFGPERSIPRLPVRSIVEKDSRKLLIGIDGRGIYEVDRFSGTTELLYTDEDNSSGILSSNGVYDLLVDEGNLWVATYSGGITIVHRPGKFQWWRHVPFNDQSLIHDYVNAIHEDREGNRWYATNSGISFYEPRTGRWTHYLDKNIVFLALSEDHLGRIWCGSYGDGVYVIDRRNHSIRHLRSIHGNAEPDYIYDICRDEDGDIWMGGLNFHLVRLSLSPDGEIHKAASFQINQINTITPVRGDSLFIGTSNGFYILNHRTGIFRHYFSNPLDHGIYSRSFILSGLVQDKYIWFGTDGGGLNRYDLQTGKIVNYSTVDGLPSNYICGIAAGNGCLWISSSDGIFCFDPQQEKVLFSLDRAVGMPVRKFIFSSRAQLADGSLAFGSNRGVVSFDPAVIQPASASRNLVLTGFKLFYQTVTAHTDPGVLSLPVNDVSGIRLAHNRNSFSFEFVSIDLYDPQRYSYSYLLEGFDDRWSPARGQTFAEYTHIPPGEYTFRIRSFSDGEGEPLAEKAIRICILQPWWNTGWAWSGYMLLGMLLIWMVFRFVTERIALKNSGEKIRFFCEYSP